MKALAMLVCGSSLAAMTIVPVRYGKYDLRLLLVLVLVAALAVYWIGAVIDLLRLGPGEARDWWLATLAVVVVLGPIGALAYRVASPRFAANEERPRSIQH